MRLIDADELREYEQSWDCDYEPDGYSHVVEVKDIDNIPTIDAIPISVLDDIRKEITEYGSIWVEYTIKGHSDSDIEKIVENVLKQAKEQVIEILDRHISRKEDLDNETDN